MRLNVTWMHLLRRRCHIITRLESSQAQLPECTASCAALDGDAPIALLCAGSLQGANAHLTLLSSASHVGVYLLLLTCKLFSPDLLLCLEMVHLRWCEAGSRLQGCTELMLSIRTSVCSSHVLQIWWMDQQSAYRYQIQLGELSVSDGSNEYQAQHC